MKGGCSFSSVLLVRDFEIAGVFSGGVGRTLGISNKKRWVRKDGFSFTEWFNLFFYKYFFEC